MIKIVTNIYLGAAFLTHGARLRNVDHTDPQHVAYEFEGENLEQIKFKWIAGELQGNLLVYAGHVRNLKQELYVHE